MSCLLWFWSLFRRRKQPNRNPENPEDAVDLRHDGAQTAKRQSKKRKNWRIFRKKKRETKVEVEEEAGQSSAEQGPAGVQHPGAAKLLPAPVGNAENPAGGEEATNSVPDETEQIVDQRQETDNEVLKKTEETEDEDVKELVNFLLNETEKQVELQETKDQEVDSERITELTENTLDDLESSCNELEDKLLKLMEEAKAAEARINEWKREEAEAFAHEEYGFLCPSGIEGACDYPDAPEERTGFRRRRNGAPGRRQRERRNI